MRPSCKICSAQTRLIFDKQFQLNYYVCPECEFIFSEKAKQLSSELEKKEYLRHHNSLENNGYVEMFRQFINVCISPYKDQVKRILDFGSGPVPVFGTLLKELGFVVEIYDILFAPEKIRGKFDLISSIEVFEHFYDPLKNIRIIREHLEKQGLLAIMTRFHDNNVEAFLDWWYRRDKTHVSFYNQKTLKIIANLLGFEVLFFKIPNICLMRLR